MVNQKQSGAIAFNNENSVLPQSLFTEQTEEEEDKKEEKTIDTCQDLLQDQLLILRRLRPLMSRHYKEEKPKIERFVAQLKSIIKKLYKQAQPHLKQTKETVLHKLLSFIDWLSPKHKRKETP